MPPKIVSRSQNKPRFQINLQLSKSALGLTARNLAQLYHTTDQFMPDKSKIAAKIEDIEVKLFALYEVCNNTKEYEYFLHTIKFLYIKLALKYLTLDMMEDAIYLGVKTGIPEIVAHC